MNYTSQTTISFCILTPIPGMLWYFKVFFSVPIQFQNYQVWHFINPSPLDVLTYPPIDQCKLGLFAMHAESGLRIRNPHRGIIFCVLGFSLYKITIVSFINIYYVTIKAGTSTLFPSTPTSNYLNKTKHPSLIFI